MRVHDSQINSGSWLEWRSKRSAGPAELAKDAQAWCVSSYWKSQTPRLEDWKAVVEDLGAQGLSESTVEAMAAQLGTGLPFPLIPLFEIEQLGDFCGVLADLDAAAAVAGIASLQYDLFTASPASVLSNCWEHLRPETKGGISLAAWQWMLSDDPGHALPFPASDDLGVLTQGSSPRQTRTVQRLENMVRSRLEAGGDLQSALQVADALLLWKQPAFLQWALRLWSQSGGAGPLLERLQAAVEGSPGFELDDPALAERLRKLEFRKTLSADKTLCRSLFTEPLELTAWEGVRSAVLERKPGAAERHPFSAMAEWLQAQDFPISLDASAWEKLVRIFQQYPALVDVDPAHPNGPLPAVELAAGVRSTATIGEVALDIVQLAPPQMRLHPKWWESLDLGLRDAGRKGGDRSGDGYITARQVLQLHAHWLSKEERDAMNRTDPLTLYAPSPAAYSLSRRESASGISHAAVLNSGGDGKRRGRSGGLSAAAELEERLQQHGGISARLETLGNEARISVRSWPAAGYRPPDKVFVLGWADSIREHLLSTPDLRLKSAEHALVPVDADAQNQLQRWLEGLHGLPRDLRIAMLHGMVHNGLLEGLPPASPAVSRVTPDPPSKTNPPWLWIIVAALLGLAAGGAGVAAFMKVAPPTITDTAAAPADAASQSSAVAELEKLEKELSQSSNSEIKALYEAQLAPFLQPASNPGRRTAEARMVLRLAGVWTAANQEPEVESRRMASETPNVAEAVRAVACLAGAGSSSAVAGGPDCSYVNWPQARQGLETLTRYVSDRRAEAAPANPAVNTENTAPGRGRGTGKAGQPEGRGTSKEGKTQ